MKKSQLRNIIRESIKELITEQTLNPDAYSLMLSFMGFSTFDSAWTGPNSPCNPNTPAGPQYGMKDYLINFFNTGLVGPSGNNVFFSGVQGQPCQAISGLISTLQQQIANSPNPNNQVTQRR